MGNGGFDGDRDTLKGLKLLNFDMAPSPMPSGRARCFADVTTRACNALFLLDVNLFFVIYGFALLAPP